MTTRTMRLTPGQRSEMAKGKHQMFVPVEVLGIASVAPDEYHGDKFPGISGLHLESHSGVNSATATNGVSLIQVCWNQLLDGDTDMPPLSIPHQLCSAVELDGGIEAAVSIRRVEDGLLVDHRGELRSIGKITAVREFVALGDYPQSEEAFELSLDENHAPNGSTRVFISLGRLREVLDAIDDLAAVGMDEDDRIELRIKGQGELLMIRTAKADMKVRAIMMPLAETDESIKEFADWPAPRQPGNTTPRAQ